MSAVAAKPRPTKPAPAGPPAFTAKTQASDRGPLRRLPNVVLFSTGWHTDMHGRRKFYDADYLRKVADNYAELLHDDELHVEPPNALGHEKVQAELAKILAGDDAYQQFMADHQPTQGGGPGRTDQPAAGWPENVRFEAESGRLLADFERLPPKIADMIDADELRYPSVEFKEDFARGDRPVGPVLWRVALLGATPPGCKTIPPLGQSYFADAAPEPGVVYFADGGTAVAAMPKALTRLLQERYPDLPPDFLASLDEKQINRLVPEADAADPALADANADPAAGLTPAQMRDEMVAAGYLTADAAAAMSDDEITQKYREWKGTTAMSETNKTPAPPPVSAFADRQRLRDELKAELVADLAKERDAIKAAAAAAAKQIGARVAQERRAEVYAFCEAELKAGRVAPFEMDESDPKTAHLSLPQRLLRKDAATPVACFADGGAEVTKTELEIEMEAVRLRPVRAFGEHLRQPAGGAAGDAARVKKLQDEARAAYAARRPATDIPLETRLGVLPARHMR